MKKLFLLACVVFQATSLVHAQITDTTIQVIYTAGQANTTVAVASTTERKKFFSFQRLKLIETFDQQFKSSEPAFYSATNPDSGKTAYQVQAAIGYTFIDLPKLSVSALYEWHQNTALNKPQNVRQYGISVERIDGDPENFFLSIRGNIKWSNDLKDDKKSFILTGLVSPYFKPEKAFWKAVSFDDTHPPAAISPKFANWLQYSHNITAGIDAVNFYDAAIEEAQGTIVMGHLEYEIHAYPFSGFLYDSKLKAERLLDVYYVGLTRYEIDNKTDDKREWRPLQRYGVAVTVRPGPKEKKREIKFAVERVYGEDVLKGLKDQKYWQVGLKVKI